MGQLPTGRLQGFSDFGFWPRWLGSSPVAPSGSPVAPAPPGPQWLPALSTEPAVAPSGSQRLPGTRKEVLGLDFNLDFLGFPMNYIGFPRISLYFD